MINRKGLEQASTDHGDRRRAPQAEHRSGRTTRRPLPCASICCARRWPCPAAALLEPDGRSRSGEAAAHPLHRREGRRRKTSGIDLRSCAVRVRSGGVWRARGREGGNATGFPVFVFASPLLASWSVCPRPVLGQWFLFVSCGFRSTSSHFSLFPLSLSLIRSPSLSITISEKKFLYLQN
jgi:hypothetical protein